LKRRVQSSRFKVSKAGWRLQAGGCSNGNGVNRKGRKERQESPVFFSKNKPLPSFAFLASFAVQVFAVAVAFYSAFRISHFALD
jgi:hypothetical protein